YKGPTEFSKKTGPECPPLWLRVLHNAGLSCVAANPRRQRSRRVIRDRCRRSCLPVHVRFASKEDLKAICRFKASKIGKLCAEVLPQPPQPRVLQSWAFIFAAH